MSRGNTGPHLDDTPNVHEGQRVKLNAVVRFVDRRKGEIHVLIAGQPFVLTNFHFNVGVHGNGN